MRAELICESPTAWPLDEESLEQLTTPAVIAAFQVGLENAEAEAWDLESALSIAFLDDVKVTELNRQFRDKPQPTNVLSWPNYEGTDPQEIVEQGQDDGSACYWGDLALAGQTVTREALEQEKSFEAHLSHLIIHGVLHLLGYDHIEDRDAELMEGLEKLAMRDLGYPDPYADPRT